MVSAAASIARLAACAVLVSCGTVSAQPTIVVPTVEVGAAAHAAGFEIEGALQAVKQATVAAQVQGRVLALPVKVGDRVKAGQLLARIDSRELQASMAGSVAAVAQAQAALVQAQQQASRTRELRNQGFVSAAALDDAQSRLDTAQAALQQAQAGRGQAALAEGFATVGAPFDGVVLATHAEVGDLATPGRALVTLYAPGQLRAVVQLPSSRSGAARAAPQTELLLPDGRRVTPTARSEAPGSDPSTQSIEWRLDLPAAASAGLLPGQPVTVRFQSAAPASAAAHTPGTVSVPAAAVLQRGELSAVYVAQGTQFVLRAVRLGSRQGDRWTVQAGLKAGERVAGDAVRAGLAGARAP
jgi:RND family efflux transporter MFP subunit